MKRLTMFEINYLCRRGCNPIPTLAAKRLRHVIPDAVKCDVSGDFAGGGFIMRISVSILPWTLSSSSCLPLILTVLPDN